MGLLDAVREIRVDEPGVAFVDGRGRRWGTVPANTSGKGRPRMTSEYEIMRGDLVRVLHEAAKDDARFVFGASVESFRQDGDSVLANFSDGTSEEFDLLIGADGQGSRVRRHVLPANAAAPEWPVGIHMAYWFIPRDATDDSVRETEFFYSQEVVQIRTGTWSRGRVALVGDAGYCGSPYSGMGTSAALVGAYVLAGEINRNPDDVTAAFAQYEAMLRPFVDHLQAGVDPKLLRFGFPEGRLGINSIRTMGAVATFLRLPELAARFAKEDRGGDWPLPDHSQVLAV